MKTIEQDYKNLHQQSRKAQILTSISHLLEWDQETHMPKDGGDMRGEQLQAIARLIHKERTGQNFKEALSKLIDIDSGQLKSEQLDAAQKAALREWHRDYVKDTAMPDDFVEEFALLSSQSQLVWRKAKQENDFQSFAPFLKKIIEMNRRKADLLGYEAHPYDALVDLYEPQMTTEKLDTLFSGLKTSVSQLVKKIANAKQIENSFLFGEFDHEQQISFGKLLLDAMGYAPTKGRLDFSVHPFSSSLHPNDNRITTRIHPSSLMSNILAVLHEGGHALYEMGLPLEHYGSPLGQSISLGIHESQSRWWETRIGLHKCFWDHYYPLLQRHFRGKLDAISLDEFYRAINQVKPSLIRIEADEVTYPLHVIVRFELEKALISGELDVKDLPEAWNAKMQELLGIKPMTDSEGCMQDIHWSMGAFGYFPTYALGNIYAAHIFPAFEENFPEWEKRVASGDLHFVKKWLNQSVHQYGRQYTSDQLLEKISGKPVSADAYIDYVNCKYADIYQF